MEWTANRQPRTTKQITTLTKPWSACKSPRPSTTKEATTTFPKSQQAQKSKPKKHPNQQSNNLPLSMNVLATKNRSRWRVSRCTLNGCFQIPLWRIFSRNTWWHRKILIICLMRMIGICRISSNIILIRSLRMWPYLSSKMGIWGHPLIQRNASQEYSINTANHMKVKGLISLNINKIVQDIKQNKVIMESEEILG